MRGIVYWLAPAALLIVAIALYAFLLPACAAWSFLGRYAPGPCGAEAAQDNSAFAEELARGRALEAEIRRLERQLVARANCPIIPPVVPAEEPPQDPPPEQPPVEEDQEAVFDEDRWNDRDVGMMEGCWRLDSDFFGRDTRTGEEHRITDWRICFDGEGTGSQEMQIGDLATCEGPIQVSFEDDGTLVMRDEANLPCTGRFRYKVQYETRCRLGQDRRAQCVGKDVTGPASGGPGQTVTLRRE
ncbi:MAG: hypothetical protein AAGK00_15065 [Pseudomonadota bacterium]